ncbi:MAG: hypothetical protein WCD18_10080 [Thermosynechococcaceae cyanobacterium]
MTDSTSERFGVEQAQASLTPEEQEARNPKTSGDRLRTLAALNPVLSRRVATNSAAEPDLLEQLSRSNDAETRKAVANNPNTPTEALLKLGIEFPAALFDNPIFALLLLDDPNFIAAIPTPTLRSLATLPEIPLAFRIEAANRTGDHKLLLQFLQNPDLDAQDLEKLATSRFDSVAESAKLHVNWPGAMPENWKHEAENRIKNEVLKTVFRQEKNLYLAVNLGVVPHFMIAEWIQRDLQDDKTIQKWLELIAESLATPPDILTALAQSLTPSVRSRVAGNPRTPTRILETLAANPNFSSSVAWMLAQNPSTPGFLLWQLAQHRDVAVYGSVAKNFNTPESVLQEMLRRGICIEETLWNPHLSDTFLQKWFATFWQKNSTRKVGPLADPNAPAEIIAKLAKHAPPLSVALHPNTPVAIIEQWAKFGDREMAARSPHASTRLLDDLLRKPDYHGAIVAVVNHPNVAFRTLLIETFIEREDYQYYLAERMLGGNRFEGNYVAKDADLIALIDAGWRSPEQLLGQLAEHRNPMVRRFVAQLPDAPLALLETLSLDDVSQVRLAVAQNPNAPVLLLELLAQDPDRQVRLAVAQRPDPPLHVLEKLSEDTDVTILMVVAQGQLTPKRVLSRLAQHGEKSIRQAIAKNPCTPETVLEELARDSAPDVRLAVAQNPQLPDRILIQLFDLPAAAQRYWTQSPHGREAVLDYYCQSERSGIALLTLLHRDCPVVATQANTLDWLTRYAIAQHPKTPGPIRQTLAQDANCIVRAAARANL